MKIDKVTNRNEREGERERCSSLFWLGDNDDIYLSSSATDEKKNSRRRRIKRRQSKENKTKPSITSFE
jgi:hypothetical protein